MRFIHFTQPNVRFPAPSARYGGRLGTAGVDSGLDWLFGAALAGIDGAGQGGRFPVDIHEDKENTYVRAELPGVARDSISVEFADGTLTLEASRKAAPGQGETPVAFKRQVSIPDDIQADKVSAAYENGVLTVTLPRKEEAKPRKINVSVN
jgi:HSP20 family protein